MNGPPPTPAATCRFASRPMPVRPGVGREPAVAGERQLARPCGSAASRRPARRRAGRRRRRRRRARPASSANVRVISPPAIRTPGAEARSAASPRRSVPASGSSTQSTSYSASWAATFARRDRVQRRRRVAGHPPALVEVDHDAPSCRRPRRGSRRPPRGPRRGRRGSTRIFSARNPSSRRRRADSARAAAGSSDAARRVGRDPVGGPAEQRRDGQAGDLAGDVPERRLERPVAARRGSRSSRGPGRGGRWRAGPGRRTGARTPRSQSIVSPDPMPTTPSSVSTRTIVTGKVRPRLGVPRGRERRVEREPRDAAAGWR